MTYLDKTAIDKTEPRPGGSAHGPAGPPKVMKTSGGARTPRCRVHTRVNALDSQECEHGTQECVRHDVFNAALQTEAHDLVRIYA